MFGLSNLGSEQFTTAPAQEDRSLPNPLVVSRTAVPHSHHIQLGLQERNSSFYLLLLFFQIVGVMIQYDIPLESFCLIVQGCYHLA